MTARVVVRWVRGWRDHVEIMIDDRIAKTVKESRLPSKNVLGQEIWIKNEKIVYLKHFFIKPTSQWPL